MKKGTRRLAALLALAALLLPAAPAFAAPQPTAVTGESQMHFLVDGTEYAPPEDQVGGFFYDGGYTYVPLRFVASILKKDVAWDGKNKRVSIFDPKSAEDLARIEAYLEERKVADSAIEPAGPAARSVLPIDVVPDVKYEFNGVPAAPGDKTPGLMIDNRIYVPMRFIAEHLGYRVNWDRATFTIAVDIADVDRIVKHYRELAEAIKGDTLEEARAILRELGLQETDVLLGRASEEKMAELGKIAEEWLSDIERQLDEFIEAMMNELKDAGQPTLQAELLRKELAGLIQLARNILTK